MSTRQPTAMQGVVRGKRGRLNVIEAWFDHMPEDTSGFDILICHQRSSAISPKRWTYFYTLLIDLHKTPEELSAEMDKGTVYEIRRASSRDGVKCSLTTSPTATDIDEFVSFYNEFAKAVNLSPIDTRRLVSLRDAGLLGLSRAYSEEQPNLVSHAYVCHEPQRRARLLYSASLNRSESGSGLRNLVGRANRVLHSADVLKFRERGYLTYDFGGWYAGTEDKKRLQINAFKEGFGGRVVYGFDCEEPLSVRGHLFLALRALFRDLFKPHERNELKRRREKAIHRLDAQADRPATI